MIYGTDHNYPHNRIASNRNLEWNLFVDPNLFRSNRRLVSRLPRADSRRSPLVGESKVRRKAKYVFSTFTRKKSIKFFLQRSSMKSVIIVVILIITQLLLNIILVAVVDIVAYFLFHFKGNEVFLLTNRITFTYKS